MNQQPEISVAGKNTKSIFEDPRFTGETNAHTAEDNRFINTTDNRFVETTDNRFKPMEDNRFAETTDNRFKPAEDNRFAETANNCANPVEDNRFTEATDNRFKPIEKNHRPDINKTDIESADLSDDEVKRIVKEVLKRLTS